MPDPRAIPTARYPALGALLVLLLALPAPVAAQDFLFARPVLTLSLFGGWASPAERSDVFDFTRTHLTVEEGDFASPALLGEAAYRLTERVDLTLGLEVASATVDSEMRDWVTMDDQPIPQSTRFSRLGITGSVKGYLFPRGREISKLAWVPTRWSPYVGVGGGRVSYDFVQEGDFVDVNTADIFSDEIESEGAGFTAHALAGLQLSLNPRLLLKGETRYVWGSGDLGGDFEGFERIDLSGWHALVGLSVRM